jgi:TIR domain-containing protein
MSPRGPTPAGRNDREIMTGLNPPEQGQRRVFLSYAQADKDVALSIAAALRGSGLHVWFAEWELAQGDSIAERVDAGLASSDVLVVLLSPAALAIEKYEIEFVRNGTCIDPLKVLRGFHAVLEQIDVGGRARLLQSHRQHFGVRRIVVRSPSRNSERC